MSHPRRVREQHADISLADLALDDGPRPLLKTQSWVTTVSTHDQVTPLVTLGRDRAHPTNGEMIRIQLATPIVWTTGDNARHIAAELVRMADELDAENIRPGDRKLN